MTLNAPSSWCPAPYRLSGALGSDQNRDIGQIILAFYGEEGWGAKVIDRLAFDLREAFPDKDGFSSRNLKYMRAFAVAWPKEPIVQRVVARLPWGQNLTLLERLDDPATRIWYAEQVIAHG